MGARFLQILSILLLLYPSHPALAEAQKELRLIQLPSLSSENWSKQSTEYSEYQTIESEVSIEKLGAKVVVNNYDHGKMTWNIAPSATIRANGMLLKAAPEITPKTPITVIGIGIMGLLSAYNLKQRGFENITVVAQSNRDYSYNILDGLICIPDQTTVSREYFKMAIESYKFYQFIAQKRPLFNKSLVIAPGYFHDRQSAGLERYVNHVINPAKDVLVKFSDSPNNIKPMVVYDEIVFIDTRQFIHTLIAYLIKHKVKFIVQSDNNFKHIKSKFIINCSAAKNSNNNKAKPATTKKTIINELIDQHPKSVRYIMQITKNTNENNEALSVYLLPKTNSTIKHDSRLIVGQINTKMQLYNNIDTSIIVNEAKNFYYN